jgi:hypothetical protein
MTSKRIEEPYEEEEEEEVEFDDDFEEKDDIFRVKYEQTFCLKFKLCIEKYGK